MFKAVFKAWMSSKNLYKFLCDQESLSYVCFEYHVQLDSNENKCNWQANPEHMLSRNCKKTKKGQVAESASQIFSNLRSNLCSRLHAHLTGIFKKVMVIRSSRAMVSLKDRAVESDIEWCIS